MTSATGLANSSSVDLHACAPSSAPANCDASCATFTKVSEGGKGLKKKVERKKDFQTGNLVRGGGVPTHHNPSVLPWHCRKWRLTESRAPAQAQTNWNCSSAVASDRSPPSFKIPSWDWWHDAESTFDRPWHRPLSGPLFECRLDADKLVVAFRRHTPFRVAATFDEDVLNKGSPLTERRVCNNGRGVSTERCHSNGAGRPTQRGAWCELTDEYE